MAGPRFVYPFIRGWTLECCPPFPFVNSCCSEQRCANICLSLSAFSSWPGLPQGWGPNLAQGYFQPVLSVRTGLGARLDSEGRDCTRPRLIGSATVTACHNHSGKRSLRRGRWARSHTPSKAWLPSRMPLDAQMPAARASGGEVLLEKLKPERGCPLPPGGCSAHGLFCITSGCAPYYIICYSVPHQALVTCQKFLEASCISSRQLGVLPVPHSISHSVLS